MLDWLSYPHQNQEVAVCAVTEDSQAPDAPETPAAIFAYRSLKGILFGSPDYDDNEDEDEDKENVAPAALPHEKPLLKGALPQVAVRDATPDSTPSQPKHTLLSSSSRTRERRYHVSPSPRKRRQLSPTKSILRTPGIPTPRRQNVNVTFKDVRPSISPVAMTSKLLAAAAQNESKAAIPSREAIKTTTKATAIIPTGTGKAGDEARVVPAPTVYDMSAVDAYLKSTEREMKKLVRYSQRMKEYARVSQQENVALRRERDELKREVEELRSGKVKKRGVSHEQAVKRVASGRVVGSAECVLRETALVAAQPDIVPTVKKAEFRNRGASGGDASIGKPGGQSGGYQLGRKEAGDILPQDGGQVGNVVPKKRVATTAQLPPDRLAAAKERLRVKSEERRRALSAAVG